MTRILITGGAGFIGSHLAEHHLNKGDEVWVCDNYLSGNKTNLSTCFQNPNFRFSQKDLVSDDIQEPILWAHLIYHLAAVAGYNQVLKKPLKTLHDNIHCFENLLKKTAKLNPKARILLTSSSEVYGNQNPDSMQEEATITFSPTEKTQRNYALSKYVNELTAASFIEESGLFILIARIFNTSGTRQNASHNFYVIPRFIQQALEGKPLSVYGDGSQTRSFCSVHDTVQMLDLFLNHTNVNGQILNIGNDKEISIKDLAQLICKKTKSSSEIIYVPYEKAHGRVFHDTMRRRPNLTKMRGLLGYTHRYSLEDIIDEIAQYMKENHMR